MERPTNHRELALALAGTLWACTGDITQGAPDAKLAGHPDNARPRSGDEAAASSAAGQGVAGGGASTPAQAGERDVGRVALHRLNNAEYHNTVRDLLGVDDSPAATFIADEKAAGFDNIASALGMTAAQYEQYWNAAASLAEATFANDALRRRIVTCTPSGADGAACRQQIVQDFGRRAYRRPLSDVEVARLTELARGAIALGESFEGAIQLVVQATLSSVPFLYRVELDADPSSPSAHPLSAHELASRLSYLLWSTMPDETLRSLADDATLSQDAVLEAQVDRMLDDPRGQRFVERFAGQWLGMRELQAHQVDTEVFTDWTETLRVAMVQEGLSYFAEFLHGERTMDAFFTADVSFVDDELARHYGFSGANFDASQPLSVTTDQRRGFLGLSAFLTLTSFSYRTAPTLRGKWVLENLLCTEIPPPPADVPPLDDAAADPADLQSQNVRVRLAAHRTNPACEGCHAMLDPIGLGLERFDAIGAYRDRYAGGDVIDASGKLPDGARFDGIIELSNILAQDPRLLQCATEKLVTYALGRELTPADEPHLERLREAWERDGLGLRALIKRIVLSDVFRMRRGEPMP